MRSDEISFVSFDLILTQIIGDTPARTLIQIPGIYDILSEHFYHDVLAIYEEDPDLWE